MSNEMVTIDQLIEVLNVIPSDTYALISENGVTKKVKLESLINKTLRVDIDTMEFTGSTINNKNTTLSSAFTQGTYPALLGNVATAKIYWKVVLVYNRVLTDAEIGTTMNAITTFLNA